MGSRNGVHIGLPLMLFSMAPTRGPSSSKVKGNGQDSYDFAGCPWGPTFHLPLVPIKSSRFRYIIGF
jgi:hypothetical protein